MKNKETNYRTMKVFRTEARGGSKYNDIERLRLVVIVAGSKEV